jgi:hypothetical protein
VLFSNAEIAAFIRENFVAAWESVRPVPVVEIDFGNGRKLKRTVNGNTATYVCAPDGRVLDIIPGLNAPEDYLRDLRDAHLLYQAAARDMDRLVPAYHRANQKQPMRYALNPIAYWSKARVENPLRLMVAELPQGRWPATEEERLLAADSAANRTERKPLIHKMLAEKILRPAEITKRVYKEILHCDLDDPYLGLAGRAFNGGAYENP